MTSTTLLVLFVAACGHSPTATTPLPSPTPSPASTVTFTSTPPAGTVVLVPDQYPDEGPLGAVLLPSEKRLSIGVSVTTLESVPWAQLSVYLLTGRQRLDGDASVCGSSFLKEPVWTSITPGWTASVTLSGFQVKVPCAVTAIRAVLHTRQDQAFTRTPPTPEETLAEATIPVRFEIRGEK